MRFRMFPTREIRRILLVRLSALGDVVNTLPAVSAVREAFPRARLGFIVEDRCRDVVLGHPAIDRVYVYPRKRWQSDFFRFWRWGRLVSEVGAFFREIRSERYDVALDFQGNLKGALHSWLSGSPERIGFARGHCSELNWLFSTFRVRPATEYRVEKFLSLLAPLGIAPSRPRYVLPRSEESRARAQRSIRELGWGEGDYIVLHPGTSEFGKIKRWPLDRFGALARRLSAEGHRVLVVWGPGERGMAETIAREGGPAVRVAMETRSILDLAELIAGARVFVGADSGPLHIASAVGVRSVALFGPKDPAVYGPYNPLGRVVYKPDGAGPASMEAITVEDAHAAVTSLAALEPS
jgi:lipopolysaccharide heptosyltransferase I